VCLRVVGILIVATAVAATSVSPSAGSAGRACPATSANGNVPPGAPSSFHGNGLLATEAYGVILADERTLNPDGTISEKFPWWGAPRLIGSLKISGKRLDKRVKRGLRAKIDPGGVEGAPPGTQFWSTSITFPTTGCWRIDGRVGRTTLSLVVIVRRP
jgi:hypothetical protein